MFLPLLLLPPPPLRLPCSQNTSWANSGSEEIRFVLKNMLISSPFGSFESSTKKKKSELGYDIPEPVCSRCPVPLARTP